MSSSFQQARATMVERDLKPRGITDLAVLQAFHEVPRHLFVSESMRFRAYEDHPLPIGDQQTISQPYIVASMTQSLKLNESSIALDIGTGSGYQAAILSRICKKVYSVERIPLLVTKAKRLFDDLGYDNISVKLGDGMYGWQEYAPYDGIVVAAYGQQVPPPLCDQLRVGGKLVMPVGTEASQDLMLYTKQEDDRLREWRLGRCAFVPFVQET